VSDQAIQLGAGGARRSEDIALDLMRFIALTTGYGKIQGAAGFSGKSGSRPNDEYAESLLQLYGRCLEAVEKRGG
jgi:hypothetical protein